MEICMKSDLWATSSVSAMNEIHSYNFIALKRVKTFSPSTDSISTWAKVLPHEK